MANDTIVKFIQLYRSCECLWNVSSKDYGSKLSRNTAFDMISRKMQIPGFGPREVARKIKNLKLAYQQEVKKIEKSEEKPGTGGVYRPRVIWFDLLHDFLRKSEKPLQYDRQFDNDRSTDRSETVSDLFRSIFLNHLAWNCVKLYNITWHILLYKTARKWSDFYCTQCSIPVELTIKSKESS